MGPGIAEILGIPGVNPVKKVEVNDGMALVVRIVDGIQNRYSPVQIRMPPPKKPRG